MPIYEYECRGCHRRTSVLTTRISESGRTRCSHCGGNKMQRLMSPFAIPKSEEQRLESLSDPSNLGGFDEDDPRSVAKIMKRMGKEMGEDFSGNELEAAMEEMESGRDPDGGTGSENDG
jgi:putative FmdB family regulatory protein